MNGIDKITQRIGADTQAEIDRSVRLLAEQAYERMLDTEQLAAGWAEGTCNSIQKDVYI